MTTASTAAPLSPKPNTEQTEELATLERWKSGIGIPTFPGPQTACGARRKPSEQPQERRLPAAARHPNLQDHLPLELKIDFRIILRLEYASALLDARIRSGAGAWAAWRHRARDR